MASDEPINNFETNTTRSTSAEPGRRRRGADAPAGRYDRRSSNTRQPAAGVGQPPKSRNTDTTIAAVEDPMGDGRERLFATINRRVDILEDERSHRRISEAAYRIGRQIQTVFERAGRVSGTNWAGTSRIDAREAQATAIEKGLDAAAAIQRILARIRDRVGIYDMRLLRRLLGDRQTFAQCASFEGKAGERGERYVAARFRDALEELARGWQATGKLQPVPDDKHKTAGAAAAAREAASIAAGVTATRVTTEAMAELINERRLYHLAEGVRELVLMGLGFTPGEIARCYEAARQLAAEKRGRAH